MPPFKIRKRNDEIVDFERSRIEAAIEAACIACGEPDRSFIPVVTDFIIKDIDHSIQRIPQHIELSVKLNTDCLKSSLGRMS